MSTVVDTLKELRACPDGIKWAASGGVDAVSGWASCERGDWLAWYAGKRAGATETLVAALSECVALAQLSFPGLPNDGDVGLAAAKIIAAVAAKRPGQYAGTMKACADIIRKHFPTAP